MSLANRAALEFVLSAPNTVRQTSASSSTAVQSVSSASCSRSMQMLATSKMELAQIRQEIICHHGNPYTRVFLSSTLCKSRAVCWAAETHLLLDRHMRSRSDSKNTVGFEQDWSSLPGERKGRWMRALRW